MSVVFDTELLIVAAVAAGIGLLLGVLLTSLLATRRIGALEAERERLRASVSSADEQAREREATLEAATDRLRARFDELAARSLRDNSENFLRLARENLGQYQTAASAELGASKKAIDELVRPIAESLEATKQNLARIEAERREAFGAIDSQLKSVSEAHRALHSETSRLVTALQRPDVGGQWGEITLRRLVELAGMVEHCDFVEQSHTPTAEGAVRPDLIVRLPDRGEIIVDAKTPLDGYLGAAQATDDRERTGALDRHARNLRQRVRELAAKSYWSQFRDSPDFVVLFVPGEQFLSAALSRDPALLEDALKQKVLLVTPTSLMALLKAVAYGWRHLELTRNTERIRDTAEELYRRIANFSGHMASIGSALERSVGAFNAAVGSLERQVLPGARRFTEMGVTERKTLADIRPVDKTIRRVTATADVPVPATGDDDPESSGGG